MDLTKGHRLDGCKLMGLLGLMVVAFFAGCIVEPREESTTRVHLNIELDLPMFQEISTATLSREISFKRGFSRVSLSENPLVIVAEVNAMDLPAPVTARYAGDPGDDDEVVELGLEAPSGSARELFLILYYLEDGTVHTFKDLKSELEFEPGDQSITLEPERADTWVLDGILEGVGGKIPVSVVVEDVQSQIEFPEAPVEDGPLGWEFSFDDVPVGRFFYLRVHWDDDTSTDLLNFCPLFFGQPASITKVINLEDETC